MKNSLRQRERKYEPMHFLCPLEFAFAYIEKKKLILELEERTRRYRYVKK